MPNEVHDKIIEIIAEQAILDTSDVSSNMTIEQLGLDSLALVEAVFSIEESFGISVPFNANDPQASDFDITSVGSIINAVEGLVKDQSA